MHVGNGSRSPHRCWATPCSARQAARRTSPTSSSRSTKRTGDPVILLEQVPDDAVVHRYRIMRRRRQEPGLFKKLDRLVEKPPPRGRKRPATSPSPAATF
ncbi:MAG: hypothetical protein R3F11_13145 [Verrucomicrobiales bacterium]